MHVREIWRYPVKSIGGERLEVARVTALGIDGDRRWGIRDLATGKILTARRTPKLLMATASVVAEHPVITTVDGDPIDGSLAEMSNALSIWLGQPVELVAAGDEGGTFENPMNVEHEVDWVSWVGPAHAFHDSVRTRVSLVSSATLGDRDIRRFRANVVLDVHQNSSANGDVDRREVDDLVRGVSGAEDAFVGSRVRLGSSIELHVTKQIDRCIMVTRAQPGLPSDLEVLKRVIRERSSMLGVGSLVGVGGRLAIGDELRLLTDG